MHTKASAGFFKLALGHYEELPVGYRKLVDDYLDGERGWNLMVWYVTEHTPCKNARYELHRPDLFFRTVKMVELTDRNGRLSHSHLAAYLCSVFFVRNL